MNVTTALAVVPEITTSEQDAWMAAFQARRRQISFWTYLVVLPLVGWVGIVANILGAITIKSIGLQKSSNCLIFGLAFADLGYSLYFSLDIPLLLLIVNNTVKGTGWAWWMSYPSAQVCFVVHIFIWVLASIAGSMSTFITVLIAIERLLAVFFPLQFASIVTPKRAVTGMGVIFILSIFTALFEGTTHKLVYDHSINRGTSGTTSLFEGHYAARLFYRKHIRSYLLHITPLVIILASSVAISIKLVLARRKREEMLNKKQKSSSGQTTITLLAVCFLFCAYKMMRATYEIMNGLAIGDSVQKTVAEVAVLTSEALLIQVNHSANFFIYIILNNRIRNAFFALFKGKRVK